MTLRLLRGSGRRPASAAMDPIHASAALTTPTQQEQN